MTGPAPVPSTRGQACCQRTARSTLERFLQLAGDLVSRGLHGALHDSSGLGKRLVESFFDGWLANHDEPRLACGELFSRLMEFPAGKGPAPEPLGDDTDVRAVH